MVELLTRSFRPNVLSRHEYYIPRLVVGSRHTLLVSRALYLSLGERYLFRTELPDAFYTFCHIASVSPVSLLVSVARR